MREISYQLSNTFECDKNFFFDYTKILIFLLFTCLCSRFDTITRAWDIRSDLRISVWERRWTRWRMLWSDRCRIKSSLRLVSPSPCCWMQKIQRSFTESNFSANTSSKSWIYCKNACTNRIKNTEAHERTSCLFERLRLNERERVLDSNRDEREERTIFCCASGWCVMLLMLCGVIR